MKSVIAYQQSDQSLTFLPEEMLDPWLTTEHPSLYIRFYYLPPPLDEAIWGGGGGNSFFIMPPTLEKLKGHIAFGLSVRPSIRPYVRYKIY